MSNLTPAVAKATTPFDRIIAEIQARKLSESGTCVGAGLDASTLAKARGRRSKALDVTTLKALCDWLQKPVSWALGEAVPAAVLVSTETPDGYLSYNQLVRSDLNPRKDFGELTDAANDTGDLGLAQLAESIRENGILQNLLVRPMRLDDWRPVGLRPDLAHYVIVFGERRWRAIGILVKEGAWDPDAPKIPARIREMEDEEHIALAILENLQRKNMNPMEEAEAFAKLQKLDKVKWSPAEIAKKIGATTRMVQQRLQLVKSLDKPAKDALRAGTIGVKQARIIAQAPQEQRKDLFEAAVESETSEGELKRIMLEDYIPASRALFVVEGEGAIDAGPMITEEESGDLYFTSKKAFMREQGKAAKKHAESLRKENGLGFVKRVDYWYGNSHEKAEGDKAGVYYEINPHHGEAEFHVGYKERQQRTYSYSRSGHKTAEQKAKEAAATRRKTAYATLCKGLGAAVEKSPAIAMRLAILTQLVNSDAENLPLGEQGVFKGRYYFKGYDLPAKLAALCTKDDRAKDGADRGALWKAVMGLTDNQVANLLAIAIACAIDRPHQYGTPIGVKRDFGPDSLVGMLAAELEVEVPDALLSAKQKLAAE